MELTLGPEEKVRDHSVLHRTPAGSVLHPAVLLSMDQRSEGPRWESNMKKWTYSKVIYLFIYNNYAYPFLLLGNVGLDKLLQNTRIVDVGTTTSTQVPISLSVTITKKNVKHPPSKYGV